MVVCNGITILLTILFNIILYITRIDFKLGFFMLVCIVSIIRLNYFYAA